MIIPCLSHASAFHFPSPPLEATTQSFTEEEDFYKLPFAGFAKWSVFIQVFLLKRLNIGESRDSVFDPVFLLLLFPCVFGPKRLDHHFLPVTLVHEAGLKNFFFVGNEFLIPFSFPHRYFFSLSLTPIQKLVTNCKISMVFSFDILRTLCVSHSCLSCSSATSLKCEAERGSIREPPYT